MRVEPGTAVRVETSVENSVRVVVSAAELKNSVDVTVGVYEVNDSVSVGAGLISVVTDVD